MKKLIIALASAALVTTAANAQETVRIATEGAYAPWNFVDDDGNAAGFEIDLGNEICARAELNCEWVLTAWDTMIPNLLAGNYDVIMAGMSITAERLESINFSEEYYPPDPSLFAMAADAEIDFAALTGLRIGAQAATIQLGYIEDNLAEGNTVLAYETFDQAVADLAAGNLDLVLADAGYIEPIVAATDGALVLAEEHVQVGGGVGAGMRKEDTDLLATFSEVIAEMKADGTLNALITQWFDNPNTFD